MTETFMKAQTVIMAGDEPKAPVSGNDRQGSSTTQIKTT